MKSRFLPPLFCALTAILAARAFAQNAPMMGIQAPVTTAPTKVVLQPARVAGIVHNGTTQLPASNVAIELVRPGGLMDGQTGAVLKTVRTGTDGRFDFGSLTLNPKEILTTRVRTKGFDYESPAYDATGQLKQFLPPGAKPIDSKALDMTVFDSSSAVPLVFTVHHVAIATDERRLKVIERIVAENPTRTTFTGGPDGATIRLNLPPTATDVTLDDKAAPGGKLLKKDDGWWVIKAITPAQYGSRNAVIVQYHMDYQGGIVDLSRKLAYPVKFFFMAREQKDKDLIITAPELGKDTVQQIPIDGNMSDRIVDSKGQPMGPVVFPAGTLITMHVARPADPMKWGFVAFVVLLCLTVPAAMLLLRRSPAQKIAEPLPVANVSGAHRDGMPHATLSGPLQIDGATRALIERIAVLDETWDAGDISRNEYLRQRAALKAEALAGANETLGDNSTTLP